MKTDWGYIMKYLRSVIVSIITATLFVGCGGGSGGGGTQFDNIGASLTTDGTAAVIADTDKNIMTVEEGAVVWEVPGSDNIVIYYGADGYPTRAVIGGNIICFGGWDTTANTVNVGFVLPDGTTKTEHNVAVDSAMLARLAGLISSNPTAAQILAHDGTQKLFGFSNSDLAWAAGFGGTLLSSALCGAAIGSAMVSAGVTAPGVALACASTLMYFATELEIIDSNNSALAATGGTLLIIDAAQCAGMDPGACAGIVLTATEAVLETASNTTEEHAEQINIIEAGLPYGGGAIQVTLKWEREVDLDLHVRDTNSEEIYWDDKTSASGGFLDQDDRVGGTASDPAIENVFWESNAPAGSYTVWIYYFSGSGATNYELVIMVDGETVGSYPGTLNSQYESSPIQAFTYP